MTENDDTTHEEKLMALGARIERDVIVKWLRANRCGCCDPWQDAADEIERGAHHDQG